MTDATKCNLAFLIEMYILYINLVEHGRFVFSLRLNIVLHKIKKPRHFKVKEALKSFDRVSQTSFQPPFKVLKIDVTYIKNFIPI